MTEEEKERILGNMVLSRRKKRETLQCLKRKVTLIQADLRSVADALAKEALDQSQFPDREFQEHTPKAWAAKLRDDNFQKDGMKWPTWEEVSQTFRDIGRLKSEIATLNSQIQ